MTQDEDTQTIRDQGDVRTQNIRDAGDSKHENVLRGYLKLILWATAIVVVASFVSVIRSFYVQDSVDRLSTETKILEQQTGEARLAAVEARDALTNAIEQLNSSDELTPGTITNALTAINRIERQLCGGPCDE